MYAHPSLHPVQVPARRSVAALPPGLFARIAGLYLRDAPGVVDDIVSAVSAGDAHGVARGAHRLKSSSALVGARDVSAVCCALERAGQSGDLGGAPRLTWALEEHFAETIEALASVAGEKRGLT